MCRWAAWCGAPIFLSEVITHPEHSLIAQSRQADECKTTTNADGFGLAWYDHHREPGLYRDVYPAWSDPNLRSVARQVKSGLFLAHVRASTGTATSRNNCHPFVHDNWSFMHNGQVGGFDGFRKSADMAIPDALYPYRKGATDSEALFLLALEAGLDRDPFAALSEAVGQLETLSRASGTTPHMRLTAAFSDGERLYAVRYASDNRAPSLYYRRCPDREGWLVVSEPLDDGAEIWTPVGQGQVCVFDASKMYAAPFGPLKRAA